MIASFATIESRKAESEKTYRSLRKQTKTFGWAGMMNGRMDDARKFAADFRLERYSGYILTCDDDLIYPPDYCAYMVQKCEEHGCPVSLMGRVVTGASDSYYKDKGAVIKYDWRDPAAPETRVHIPGTGVMCYHTDQIRFSWDDFPGENMADIMVGIACNGRVPVMRVPPPKRDWIKYQEVPDTIYDRHLNDDAEQTKYMNDTEWESLLRKV